MRAGAVITPLSTLAAAEAQPALDHSPTGLGAHPAGVGPATEKQAEPRHHHRLTGTGLAGDDIQSRLEGNFSLLHDSQVPYM